MVKAKLQLDALTDEEFIAFMELIVTRMTANVTNFPTPSPALTALTANAYELNTLLNQRKAYLSQAQQATLAIRAKRDAGVLLINNEAAYVELRANASTDPNNPPDVIITSAGMEVAGTPTPVGPMPKVEGLFATQGDVEGEIDLHWNAIKRGLRSYNVEKTADPAGATGWTHAATSTKSSITIAGLTPNTRYWFRVAAVGTAGQGPWSDPATKVAP